MVPVDRFLEGLFAPHGGINFQPAKHPSTSNQLMRVIDMIIESFRRPLERSDFALCH